MRKRLSRDQDKGYPNAKCRSGIWRYLADGYRKSSGDILQFPGNSIIFS
jgi:hypothetical protein